MTDKIERAQFPILGSRGATIDMQLVKDHGKQAQDNHYQTVERLAARGGLSWCELHAVLHDHKWEKVDENTAITECRAVEARYLAAIPAPSGDEVERLRVALEAALTFLQSAPLESGCCMCGDPVAGHNMGSGHSPVDDLAYYAEQVADGIRQALKGTPV